VNQYREGKAKNKIINGSRRKRIAKGSGTKVEDINRLLKNFTMTKKMMEQFTSKGRMKMPAMLH